MILLIEYFVPDSKERLSEYLYCIEENIKNENISKIEVFISDDSILNIKSDKININKLDIRPTYEYFFNFCTHKYMDNICILSNSDIVFDNTLSHITNENIEGKFLALSRWDTDDNNNCAIFRGAYGDSQDTWIFKAPINIVGDFNLGKLGCDNKISYLAYVEGYDVINPCKQIRIKHVHNSDYRTISSSVKDTIEGQHLLVPACDNIDSLSNNKIRSWFIKNNN